MDCPRCKVPLTLISTVVDAQLCGECDGIWLSGDALEKCLHVHKDYLRNSPLWVTLEADHPDIPLDPLVCCPECKGEMKRYPFDAGSKVIVDGCPEHGLWLDDRELAKIYDYRESHPDASPAKGKERVSGVSSGVWSNLAGWFQRMKPARS